MPTDLTPIIQQQLDAEGVSNFGLASKIAVAISLAIQGWCPPAETIRSIRALDRLQPSKTLAAAREFGYAITPAAFGTEQNAKDWYAFIERHLDLEHDIAIVEVTR